MSRKVVILFFQAGPVATDAEMIAGTKLGARFRNASQVLENDNPEKCDAVAGLVPPIYRKHPRADVPSEQKAEVAAPVAPVAPVVVQEPAPAVAPVAPAVVTEPEVVITPAPIVEEKPVDPLAGIDESEVSNFSAYSIDAIMGMVKRGEITKERALELEKRGKNRPTCIKRLTEVV